MEEKREGMGEKEAEKAQGALATLVILTPWWWTPHLLKAASCYRRGDSMREPLWLSFTAHLLRTETVLRRRRCSHRVTLSSSFPHSHTGELVVQPLEFRRDLMAF